MDWWVVPFLVLVALTVFEWGATYRFELYRLGLLVWRDVRPSFTHEISESIPQSRTRVLRASADRWLFQRVSLWWMALQYKGTIRQSEQGTVLEVRVPLFGFLLMTFGACCLFFINGDAGGALFVLAAIPVLILVERWLGIRAAREILRAATSLTCASSRTPSGTLVPERSASAEAPRR
ncbi:MAG: hypothetical protein U1E29_06935 [Coriobacteriia bacterium]|nr:hypothetical protein [Coriobacteriia bacterium]